MQKLENRTSDYRKKEKSLQVAIDMSFERSNQNKTEQTNKAKRTNENTHSHQRKKTTTRNGRKSNQL